MELPPYLRMLLSVVTITSRKTRRNGTAPFSGAYRDPTILIITQKSTDHKKLSRGACFSSHCDRNELPWRCRNKIAALAIAEVLNEIPPPEGASGCKHPRPLLVYDRVVCELPVEELTQYPVGNQLAPRRPNAAIPYLGEQREA